MHAKRRGALGAAVAAGVTVALGAGLAATLAAGLAAPVAAQAPEAGGGAPTGELPPNGTPVVYVNTQVIIPVAPGADSAMVAFQAIVDGYEAELAGLEAEFDSLLNAYQAQESLMDPAGRQMRQQELQDKQQQAMNRQQEMNVESERRRADLLAPIVEQVTAVIEEIRAERGYAVVFDVAAAGLVAADEALDITLAVLERLGVDPATVTPPGS